MNAVNNVLSSFFNTDFLITFIFKTNYSSDFYNSVLRFACVSYFSQCNISRLKFATVCVSTGYRKLEGNAVAQWLRYCATNRKVAGSIPAGATGIFH